MMNGVRDLLEAQAQAIAAMQSGWEAVNEAVAEITTDISQATVQVTNSSGIVSWTFPTPFSAPPVISADVLAGVGQPYSVAEISRTATAVSLQIQRSAGVSVSLIGLTVRTQLVNVGAGLNVHILATKAT